MTELAPVAPTAVSPAAQGVPAAGPTVAPNRRQRLRLRDLCDEVLASFRAARERDVITDDERRDARTALAGLGPRRN
jgi:hypothetical protein